MADEVFSGGVSVTGVEPGTTTIAIKSTTNPNISKKVPVTVKSRNLLAYGPASGNGLTVTVAQDGSLDFSSGTESVPLNKGVRWKFDVPEGIVGVPLIISYTGNVPGNLIIGIYANANSLGGVYQGKNNTVVTIPKGTTRVELRILRGGVTAGSVSGNLKIQLELGNTAHEWMKPDVTSLEGGGYELANLVPSFASLLPKTINGVTFTSRDGHTVHVKGTTTAWAQANQRIRATGRGHLHAHVRQQQRLELRNPVRRHYQRSRLTGQSVRQDRNRHLHRQRVRRRREDRGHRPDPAHPPARLANTSPRGFLHSLLAARGILF